MRAVLWMINHKKSLHTSTCMTSTCSIHLIELRRRHKIYRIKVSKTGWTNSCPSPKSSAHCASPMPKRSRNPTLTPSTGGTHPCTTAWCIMALPVIDTTWIGFRKSLSKILTFASLAGRCCTGIVEIFSPKHCASRIQSS